MPPLPAPQYRPPPAGRRRAASISDLIMRRGDIAARGAMRSGMIWGNVANQLGQIGAGAVQQNAQQKQAQAADAEQERRAAAFGDLMQDPKMFDDAEYAFTQLSEIGYEPERSMALAKGFGEFKAGQGDRDPNKAAQRLPYFAAAYLAADESTRPGLREGIEGWMYAAQIAQEGSLADVSEEQFLQYAQALAEKKDDPKSLVRLEEESAARARGTVSAQPTPTPPKPLERIEAESAARARGTASAQPPPTPPGPGEGKYVLDREAELGTPSHVSKTPEEIAAEPSRYGRPLLAAPTDELRRVETNLFAFKDINSALTPVLDKIGPVEWTLREMQQKIPGLESDPSFRAFQQLVNALTNEEIRRITGAQMSASEAERLKKGMADGTLRLPELKEALYLWQRGMERTRAGLMGNLKKWSEANPYTPTYFFGDSGVKALPKETRKAIDDLFPPE